MPRSQIAELADTSGWRGAPTDRQTEPGVVTALPMVDNSNRFSNTVRTSIDCYVSGTYVTRKGGQFTVRQRYTIFVAYNKDTQAATMSQVRARIMGDFQAKYGKMFNVTNVFVPGLPVPKDDRVIGLKPGAEIPQELYFGSALFKQMSKFERVRYEIGTERSKASGNIDAIRKRYGERR